MVEAAERYCLIDDGTRFWADQFRHLDNDDESELIKHFHLTLARQRVVIRLCPFRTTSGWKELDDAAATFFETRRVDPAILGG